MDVAGYRVECALGAYSFSELVQGDFLDGVDREALAPALSQHSDVWSDGSKDTHEVAHIRNASAGGFSRISGVAWNRRLWSHILFCPWSLSVCPDC